MTLYTKLSLLSNVYPRHLSLRQFRSHTSVVDQYITTRSLSLHLLHPLLSPYICLSLSLCLLHLPLHLPLYPYICCIRYSLPTCATSANLSRNLLHLLLYPHICYSLPKSATYATLSLHRLLSPYITWTLENPPAKAAAVVPVFSSTSRFL